MKGRAMRMRIRSHLSTIQDAFEEGPIPKDCYQQYRSATFRISQQQNTVNDALRILHPFRRPPKVIFGREQSRIESREPRLAQHGFFIGRVPERPMMLARPRPRTKPFSTRLARRFARQILRPAIYQLGSGQSEMKATGQVDR